MGYYIYHYVSDLCWKIIGPPGRTELGEILETLTLAAENNWVECADSIWGVQDLFHLKAAETKLLIDYHSPWEDPERRRELEERQGLKVYREGEEDNDDGDCGVADSFGDVERSRD